jgi:hypothetical protein
MVHLAIHLHPFLINPQLTPLQVSPIGAAIGPSRGQCPILDPSLKPLFKILNPDPTAYLSFSPENDVYQQDNLQAYPPFGTDDGLIGNGSCIGSVSYGIGVTGGSGGGSMTGMGSEGYGSGITGESEGHGVGIVSGTGVEMGTGQGEVYGYTNVGQNVYHNVWATMTCSWAEEF